VIAPHLGHGPRFAQESFADRGGFAEFRANDLQRHVSLELGVFGVEYDAHAPLTEDLEDAVVSESPNLIGLKRR